MGDQLAGQGWLSRARSLVEKEEPCVEQGWVALGLVGCSVADAGALDGGARLAINLARHRGEMIGAAAAYESGVDLLSPGDWPLLCASLRLHLAEAEAETDPHAAVVEARAALAIYVGIGSPDAERAASLLRRLGEPARVQPPAPTALDVLTRREREVFDLLAEQLTNPEIGRRLGVTPKTVEHHVSNVLGKLGLRGRAEAAVYAMTLDRTDPADENVGLEVSRP